MLKGSKELKTGMGMDHRATANPLSHVMVDLSHLGTTDIPEFLERYGDRMLASFGIERCGGWDQDQDQLDELLAIGRPFGKTPIPLLTCGVGADPFTWEPDAAQQVWINYIINRLDYLRYVTIGSFGAESCCVGRWSRGEPYKTLLQSGQAGLRADALRELKRFKELYPEVFEARKVQIFASEVGFERDAWVSAASGEESELQQFVIDNGIRVVFARGIWCIHRDRAEHRILYRDVCPAGTWSPLHVYTYPEKGEYPFRYFSDYIKGMDAWSGVGYLEGYTAGNVRAAVDFGYKGCVVYPKPDDMHEYFKEVV